MSDTNTKDLQDAIDLNTDAMLDSASEQEQLVKVTKQNIEAVKESIDTTLEVATTNEDLIKAVKDEIESINDVVDMNLDSIIAKDSLNSELNKETKLTRDTIDKREDQRYSIHASTEAANAEIESIRRETTLRNKRIDIDREELATKLSDQQPIVEYSKLQQEMYELLVQQVAQNQRKVDKNDIDFDEDEELRKYKNKYMKQAAKEIPRQYGFFERIGKNLEKTAKTSESAMGRMSASLLKMGGSKISDTLDKLTDVPVLKQAKGAVKFVRTHRKGVKEARRQSSIKARAKELAAADRPSSDAPKLPSLPTTKRPPTKSTSKPRKGDGNKEVVDQLVKANEHLKGIHDAMLLQSVIKMSGMFGGGMIKALGAMTKSIVAAIAGAIAKKGASSLLGGSDGIDIDVDKENKGKGTKNQRKSNRKGNRKGAKFKRTPVPDAPPVDGGSKPKVDPKSTKPKIGIPNVEPDAPKGSTSKVVKKFAKILGKKAAGKLIAALVGGPVGIAVAAVMTGYDLVELADEVGWIDLDAMKSKAGEMADKGMSSIKNFMGFGSDDDEAKIPSSGTSGDADRVEAATIAQNKAKDELETKAYMAIANGASTSAATSAANMVSNTNVNNTNNYGSAFRFDNSNYQSTFDKGTQVIR